jgi:hypothetical protein
MKLKNLIIYIISFVIFSNCLGGIAEKGGKVRNVSLAPSATLLNKDSFNIIAKSEGESSTFFYLGLIPMTNPLNIEYAMSQAVQKIPGGDTIINLSIWHETHYYFPLGTVSVVKVEGDVISLKEAQSTATNPEKQAGPKK